MIRFLGDFHFYHPDLRAILQCPPARWALRFTCASWWSWGATVTRQPCRWPHASMFVNRTVRITRNFWSFTITNCVTSIASLFRCCFTSLNEKAMYHEEQVLTSHHIIAGMICRWETRLLTVDISAASRMPRASYLFSLNVVYKQLLLILKRDIVYQP